MADEKRLIDANALFGFLKEQREKETGAYSKGRNNGINVAIGAIRNEEICPTVDAVEVVHGRWEQVQRWATKAKYRCSVCGREIMSATKVNIEKYPYCHCGAKMDGERKDNG